MNKIKQCPFCGSRAVLRTYDDKYYVRCSNVGCKVYAATENEDSPEEAIRAWNKRNGVSEWDEEEEQITALEPCAICGSNNLKHGSVYMMDSIWQETYGYVMCENCGHSVRSHDHKRAIEVWNNEHLWYEKL